MAIEYVASDVISHGKIAKSKSYQKEAPEIHLVDILWIQVQIVYTIDPSNTSADGNHKKNP